jgi:uridine phosphorylase
MKRIIEASELVLNSDGSVYHLHLHPENISDNIIIVGDQDRVKEVSKHFDRIEFKANRREFVTHTGYIGNKRFTVLSTGIGTDNIDIVFNELDALVNIDLKTREVKDELISLNIVRVGTSGSLQKDIPINSIVLSSHGLGLDGLLNFYKYEQDEQEQAILDIINEKVALPIEAKLAAGSDTLIKLFSAKDVRSGITLTSTGFYGPQGRMLRLQPKVTNFIDELARLDLNGHRISNLEMETSGIYGLGKLLGHECISVNAILANRQNKTFSAEPYKIVEKAIKMTLENLLTIS